MIDNYATHRGGDGKVTDEMRAKLEEKKRGQSTLDVLALDDGMKSETESNFSSRPTSAVSRVPSASSGKRPKSASSINIHGATITSKTLDAHDNSKSVSIFPNATQENVVRPQTANSATNSKSRPLSGSGGLRKSRSALLPSLRDLSTFEKSRILAKYNEQVIHFCRKMYRAIGGNGTAQWKSFLFELREKQVSFKLSFILFNYIHLISLIHNYYYYYNCIIIIYTR